MKEVIEVRVKESSGRLFSVQSSPGDTVAKLKQIIEQESRHKAASQILLFGGDPLLDDRTLESYNIVHSTLLQLELRQVPIRLIVSLPTGKTITIEAIDDWSIATLKSKVVEKAQMLPPGSFQMFINEEELMDSQLVAHIKDNHEIVRTIISAEGGN